MTTPAQAKRHGAAPRTPFRVRLPGFVGEADIGLGDVITKSTSSLGVKPCGGCAQRAAALNRWVAFGSGSREG